MYSSKDSVTLLPLKTTPGFRPLPRSRAAFPSGVCVCSVIGNTEILSLEQGGRKSVFPNNKGMLACVM